MIGPPGARSTPPFASPLAAMSATLRRELAPWNINVVLIEPGMAAGAVARALTALRPRVTEGSAMSVASPGRPADAGELRPPLYERTARARASARSVHKRSFLCYFLAHARWPGLEVV